MAAETRRSAVFAGRFYPAALDDCRAAITEMLPAQAPPAALGAVVPHAGWVFSGRLALRGILALAAADPETLVLFGAVHGPDHHSASLYASGDWETPLGDVAVDKDLASCVAQSSHVVVSPGSHAQEHSLEVQLPLIRHCLPAVRVVPLNVRPSSHAVEIGKEVARAARENGRRVGYLASTDLTHYGPLFSFEPAGRGQQGVEWARDVNDRRFIDLIAAQRADELVAEAQAQRNACGAGAVAALLGAMRAHGIAAYQELEHATSANVRGPEAPDSVGYEVGIFPI